MGDVGARDGVVPVEIANSDVVAASVFGLFELFIGRVPLLCECSLADQQKKNGNEISHVAV